MKARTVCFCLAVAIQSMACSKAESDFRMEIEEVDELKGFIMKGISLSGEITHGCLANNDEFIVERDGEKVLKEIARIVNVRGLKSAEEFNGQASTGDYASFYIPDGTLDDVQPGDVIISDATSCAQEAERK